LGLYSVDDGMVNECGAVECLLYLERSWAYVTCSRVCGTKWNRFISKATKNSVENQGLIPGRSSKCSLFCHLEHGTWADPAFHSVDTKCSFHKHEVARAWSSWCLDTDNFTFLYLLRNSSVLYYSQFYLLPF
jgi:hypothetical protein